MIAAAIVILALIITTAMAMAVIRPGHHDAAGQQQGDGGKSKQFFHGLAHQVEDAPSLSQHDPAGSQPESFSSGCPIKATQKAA